VIKAKDSRDGGDYSQLSRKSSNLVQTKTVLLPDTERGQYGMDVAHLLTLKMELWP
jgi:hypothetical protein